MHCCIRALSCMFALAFIGVQGIKAQPENSLYLQTSEVNNLMIHYDADYGSLHRFYAIKSSPERIERLQQLIRDYQQQLSQVDFNSLSTGSRVDYILFHRDLAEAFRKLQVQKERQAEAAPSMSLS